MKGIIRSVMMALLISGMSIIKVWAQAGAAAVPFVTIPPGARSAGMGDVGTGIADDIGALFWNPGGLAFQADRQATLSYSRWLPQFQADLFYAYGAYTQFWEQLDGTVGGSFLLMNLGEYERTDSRGNFLGRFRSFEFAVSLAYATLLSEDLGGGIQFRYIQSNLASDVQGESGVGRSVAFDFGLLWRPRHLQLFGSDWGDRISAGFNLQHVGPSITYAQQADPLPTTLRLGASAIVLQDEFNQLSLAFDISKLLVYRDETGSDKIPRSFITAWKNPGVEFSIGMEYWYEQLVALRAGYFTEPTRLGDRKFFSFGAGIRYDIFGMDFSFLIPQEENHPLANTMRFSLLVNFDRVYR